MQALMITFDRFIRRHRRAVLALWFIALVAAVPFAMKQSDNLTGGGYAVSGSQSEAVRAEVERNYGRDSSATMAAVIVPAPGAPAAEVRDAVDQIARAAAEEPLGERSGRGCRSWPSTTSRRPRRAASRSSR